MSRKKYLLFFGILTACVFLFLLFGISLFSGSGFACAVLRATDLVWQAPPAFGAFHFAFLAACIVISTAFGIWGARSDARRADTVMLCAGVLLLAMEVYKQYYSYFVIQDRVFDFGFFPFQFCTLPLFLYLAVPFLREGRIKDALCKFSALFGTMGACLVMFYPAFYDRVSLCVHTMLWHTVMIAVGVFLIFSRGYGKSWRREVLPATVPFLIFVATAMVLNVALTPLAVQSPSPLNLFYISPYEPTRYFVIRDIRRSLGWEASVAAYVLLFIFLGAGLVFSVAYLLRAIAARLEKTKKR